MYGYCNSMPPPWWGYPGPMNYPYPPTAPPTKGSIKDVIREMKLWEKFQKQQQEEKKKKDDKKPDNGPKLQAWEVFVLMTALSPIIGPVVNALKDYIVMHLQ